MTESFRLYGYAKELNIVYEWRIYCEGS